MNANHVKVTKNTIIIMEKAKIQMKKINQREVKVKRRVVIKNKEEKINKNANNNDFKLLERIDNN